MNYSPGCVNFVSCCKLQKTPPKNIQKYARSFFLQVSANINPHWEKHEIQEISKISKEKQSYIYRASQMSKTLKV